MGFCLDFDRSKRENGSWPKVDNRSMEYGGADPLSGRRLVKMRVPDDNMADSFRLWAGREDGGRGCS